jgi:hypothetical protein
VIRQDVLETVYHIRARLVDVGLSVPMVVAE